MQLALAVYPVAAVVAALQCVYVSAVLDDRLQRRKKTMLEEAVNMKGMTPKSKVRSVVDDLFLPRQFMLGIGLLYMASQIGSAALKNQSQLHCSLWNSLVTMLFVFAKYGAWLFLYLKQSVIKKTIQKQASCKDWVIWLAIQILPILGVLVAVLSKNSYDPSTGCSNTSSSYVTLVYVFGALLDLLISFALLKSFLDIIKEYAYPKGGLPRRNSGSSTGTNTRASRTNSKKPLHKSPQNDKIQKVMDLNRRSCIICVIGFATLIIVSLATGYLVSKEVADLLSILIGLLDVSLDSTAMVLCSPQVWSSLQRFTVGLMPTSTAETSEASSQKTDENGDKKIQLADPVQRTVGKAFDIEGAKVSANDV